MSPRRTMITVALAAGVLALAGCTATVVNASAPSWYPRPVTSFGTLRPTVSPKPHPSTPTHTPTRPPTKPSPNPPASSISGASLGIPGAGSWKIPSWGSADRWRGPDGSQGSTGSAAVALTFDDGPGPYTSQVLDVLDQYHVKATFCLIGRQIHTYASVVKRMIDDGMTICNHSWDHDESLGTRSARYIADNLQRTIDAVHQVDPSATVAYFRQPGGNFTPTDVRVSELLGMRPLYWSEDTNDWRRPGTAAIEQALTRYTHRGSIVLMHDAGGDRTETIAAIKALIPQLQKEYKLTALSTSRTVTVPPATPLPPSAPPSSPPASVPPSTPPSAPPSP